MSGHSGGPFIERRSVVVALDRIKASRGLVPHRIQTGNGRRVYFQRDGPLGIFTRTDALQTHPENQKKDTIGSSSGEKK
jgi:putative component of toxin-antitoxin plasmid stabilization module